MRAGAPDNTSLHWESIGYGRRSSPGAWRVCGLISEAEGRFEKGDAPPAIVAVHLPEAFGETGVQRVGGMFKAFGSGDSDGLAVHRQAHVERSVVVHQRSEWAGIAVVRGDEMQRERVEDGKRGERRRPRGAFRHLDGEHFMTESFRQLRTLPRRVAHCGGRRDGARFREEYLVGHRGERSRAAQQGLKSRIDFSPIMNRRGSDQRLAPRRQGQQSNGAFDSG